MFPQNNKLFITAVDTGVGKSILTSLLGLYYLNKGKKVVICKPIQTGEEKDTDLLKNLTGNKIPIFNSYSFLLPSAPSVASKYENREISTEKIISDIKVLEKKFDVVIVEGIGGIAVPITSFVIARSGNDEAISSRKQIATSALSEPPRNDVYLVADLIKDLNYPLIVVCRSTLGTINHSVLTLEFAKKKELDVLGFVISGYDEDTDDYVVKTAPEEICRITEQKCLLKIPFMKDLSHEKLKDQSYLI